MRLDRLDYSVFVSRKARKGAKNTIAFRLLETIIHLKLNSLLEWYPSIDSGI